MCGPHSQPHASKLPMRCIQRAVTMAGRGRGDVGRGQVQCVYVATGADFDHSQHESPPLPLRNGGINA